MEVINYRCPQTSKLKPILTGSIVLVRCSSTRRAASLEKVTFTGLSTPSTIRRSSTNTPNFTPIEGQSNSRSPRYPKLSSTHHVRNSRDHGHQRSLTSRGRTTFKPISPSEIDNHGEEPLEDEPSSFLQQKAKSVMSRRTEAASLTSMTKAEKAAFDNIWKLFEPTAMTPTSSETQHVDQRDTDFRNLLELFESVSRSDGHKQSSTISSPRTTSKTRSLPAQEKTLNTRQLGAELLDDATDDGTSDAKPIRPSETRKHRSPEAELLDKTAHILVEDISTSFDTAMQSSTSDPELAMWEVCEQKVFPLTKLLIPTRSKLTADHPPSTKEDSQQATPTHPLVPPNVSLIPLLSKVYPTTLLLALRLYKRHYPTSPYCLALLPHIKSLGPTSYVLGANTHFYNTLISIRWDFYSDLDEISLLLAEMDRMGLQYDTGTANLLKRIASERDRDLRHESSATTSSQEENVNVPRGRGAGWWQMPLMERSWNRLQNWRAMVSRNLDAQGLGEVMREEGHLMNSSETTSTRGQRTSRSNEKRTRTRKVAPAESSDDYVVTL